MKRLALSILLALCALTSVRAQSALEERTNRQIFEKVSSALYSKRNLPSSELVVEVAKQFYGTPYVASTLDVAPEKLRVYLDKTDCILFVELCVAMTRTLKSDDVSYETLCDNIRMLRYRGGVVDGYGSRVHYTSEWLQQAASNGVLYEYSSEIGKPFQQDFSFMTSHVKYYPLLENNPKALREIRSVEKALKSKNPYYKISAEDLPSVLSSIKEGDIICFLRTVPGLDISHVAIACKGKDGKMHFIHASSTHKKVILEPKTLQEYSKYGIRVSRLK